MDNRLVDRALEECGYDIDSTTKRLQTLCIGSTLKSVEDSETGSTITFKDNSTQDSISLEGTEWVELLLREMKSATSVEDAKSRATRVLGSLEKSISVGAGAGAGAGAEAVHKENMLLKENMILKRAVAILHQRQKERNHEVDLMKQVVAQYQERLKTLEFNNYALTMHLKRSLHNKLPHGYSNPDVV